MDSCKPGDRVAIVGIFRPLASANGGTTSGAYRYTTPPKGLEYWSSSSSNGAVLTIAGKACTRFHVTDTVHLSDSNLCQYALQNSPYECGAFR